MRMTRTQIARNLLVTGIIWGIFVFVFAASSGHHTLANVGFGTALGSFMIGATWVIWW